MDFTNLNTQSVYESLKQAIEYIEDGHLEAARAHIELAAKDIQEAIFDESEAQGMARIEDWYGA